MSAKEAPKKTSLPQLVKLNKALQLAEQWVNNMSKPSTDEKSTEVELEGRPSRLGIGAAVPRVSKIACPSDPVARKLFKALDVDKRKNLKKSEEFKMQAKDGSIDEDSEAEELESKTKAFSKKRPPNWTAFPQSKKNRNKQSIW